MRQLIRVFPTIIRTYYRSGIFCCRLTILRKIQFLAHLLLYLTLGGCEKKESTLIDSVGTAPSISNVSLSPSIINTDSIGVGTSRSPDDQLQLQTIVSARVNHPGGNQQSFIVQFNIRKEASGTTLGTGNLNDDGIDADRTKGDGTFTGRASFQIKRVEAGTFNVEVSAYDQLGFQSNRIIIPLLIVRTNQPPLLSNLQAPDTVKLANQTQLLLLRVKVTDPNGYDDILRVIFNSIRPDGSPSSGNPFQMYDDGSEAILVQPDGRSGDQVKRDSVFSRLIELPPNTQTGTYRFEFQAFDKSNEGSNIIPHRITVKQ